MKKMCFLALVVLTLAVAALAYAKVNAVDLKAGDEVYACACGEACPCDSVAMTPGKCTCGKDLVKAKVVKVDGDKAVLALNGHEETFVVKPGYACDCGESCPCKFTSQAPGKCNCGKDLKKAE